jgi:hypothetical protein
MRIIVKEKQYNKILFRENKDQQTPNQWATYLFDRLYPYMVNEITEKNVVESNLDKTLYNQNFYKELPINKIIVNTVLGESKKNSYNIDKGDKFIKELEIDFMVTENNTLNKEDILEVFKRVIKEQTDKITFAPGVEEQLDELELYDEILIVDTVFSQLSYNKSHIHVEEVDGYKVVISQENIDDIGVLNWDIIKEYLISHQKEIEKIEGNIIHYKEDEVKDGENVVSYVDLENEKEDEISSGSGGKKIVDIENELLFIPNPNSSKFGMRGKITKECNKYKANPKKYKRKKKYCGPHMHYGQDYGAAGGAKKGTKVLLFKPGKVIKVGCECLTIKHDDGTKSRYCHLDEKMVGKGDRIEVGTFIGTVGGKGSSCKTEYDIHLHLEYYENGTRVDPVEFGKKYIRFLGKNKDYENVKI